MIQHSNYLIYQEGNINLIISSSHCGSLRPDSVPDRTVGTFVRDTWTKTVTKGLLNYFYYRPYFIYSGIHRIKVDLNREMQEGTQGNDRAKLIWKVWHDTLEFFVLENSRKYSKSLYIDIHSHNNSDEFQLGYALSKGSYLRILDGYAVTERSSVDGLGHDSYEMLFGNKSMNGLLEHAGYGVYIPKPDEIYFNGGYNIRRYTRQGLGSIQVEIPVSMCEKDVDGVIKALGYSIRRFKETFVDDKNYIRGQ